MVSGWLCPSSKRQDGEFRFHFVAHEPTAAKAPGNLLEMQTRRPTPDLLSQHVHLEGCQGNNQGLNRV